MVKIAPIILVFVFLGGCHHEVDPLVIGCDVAASWSEILDGYEEWDGDLAGKLETARIERGLPLNFWAGSSAERIGEGACVEDGPCDLVAYAWVKALPAPGETDPLKPNIAYEIDAGGRIIQRWPTTIDEKVAGIRSDELLVFLPWTFHQLTKDSGALLYLGIAPTGKYRVIGLKSTPLNAERQECPDLPFLDQPDNRGCWEFIDIESGVKRYLVYDGPCT